MRQLHELIGERIELKGKGRAARPMLNLASHKVVSSSGFNL